MTYPPEGPRSSGPGSSGYGNYGPAGQPFGAPPSPQQSQFGQSQQGQPNPSRAGDTASPLPRLLTLAVLVLGGVNFLTGLAGQYEAFGTSTNFFLIGNGDPTSVALLLAAGITAGISLLPKQPNTIGVAAALSIAGWFVLVFQSFNTGDSGPTGVSIGLGVGAVIVLLLGLIQSAAAVAVLLFSASILQPPKPKPKQVSQGQQPAYPGYGQQAGYGQQGQQGQGQMPGQQGPGQPGSNFQGQNQGQGQMPGYGGYGQSPTPSYGGPGQGYAPSSYTGQPAPNQNVTGGLGYPTGKHDAPASSGLTGPASQDSPYGQYSQPPLTPGGYGQSQHSDAGENVDQSEDASPYSAQTREFGATPKEEDNK